MRGVSGTDERTHERRAKRGHLRWISGERRGEVKEGEGREGLGGEGSGGDARGGGSTEKAGEAWLED